MRNSLSGIHPFSKFIFSLFIILLSFLIFFILGFLVAIPVFHIDILNISEVLSDYNNPENLKFLKYLQFIQGIGLFIVPAFVIGFLFHSKPKEYLKLNTGTNVKSVLLAVFILLFSLPIINFLAVFNEGMQFPEWMKTVEIWMRSKEDAAKSMTEAFLRMDSIGAFIFNLFLIAVIPAIGEELIFRGVLQRIFTEWTNNIHWGIFIAAFLFSAIHFQFYGFLPRLLLGALFGYLFYWSKSIWIPIVVHFTNNAMAVIMYYFFKPEDIDGKIESFGASKDTLLYLIPVLAIVSYLIFLFYKENKTDKTVKNLLN